MDKYLESMQLHIQRIRDEFSMLVHLSRVVILVTTVVIILSLTFLSNSLGKHGDAGYVTIYLLIAPALSAAFISIRVYSFHQFSIDEQRALQLTLRELSPQGSNHGEDKRIGPPEPSDKEVEVASTIDVWTRGQRRREQIELYFLSIIIILQVIACILVG